MSNDKKDNDKDKEDIKSIKLKRSKSFSGCYTCRRRKIACDLGRPGCQKCKKSGFVCEGYDVKLRWSQPIEFDIYGYQLPSKPNQETEYCQRRAIDYVIYPDKNAYHYYDEMDSDLAKLHNMYLESINEPTVINGHFGVLRGSKLKIKKSIKKGNKKNNTKKLKRDNNKNLKSKLSNDIINDNNSNNNNNNNKRRKLSLSSTSLSTQSKSVSNMFKSISKNQNFAYPQNIPNSNSNSNPFPQSNINSNSNSYTNINNITTNNNNTHPFYPISNSDINSKSALVGNEWLSTELLDAALLTASALNGDTHFFDMFDLDNSNNQDNNINTNSNINNNNNNIPPIINNQQQNLGYLNNNNNNNNNNQNNQNMKISSSESEINNNVKPNSNFNTVLKTNTPINTNNESDKLEIVPDSVPDQMLHLLFQGRNSMDNEGQNIVQNNNNNNNNNNNSNTEIDHSKTQIIQNDNTITNTQTQQHLHSHSHSHSESFNTSISSMSLTTRPAYNPSHISPDEIAPVEDSSLTPSTIEPSADDDRQNNIISTTNQNNKFKKIDKPITVSKINIHASNSIKMPKNIMEILTNLPLPKSLAIDKFGIPTTSLNVHPMARYLLNYYIEDVADMMTVIPLAKNPWKFIYFPRAVMAVGELASIGKTSNARNGLLNALLAVSAFNLQSKFVRGSDEMKYYVDLGIQLRRQANEFVERCMEEDILKQKYKDVLTAVLSMVTIDVVWGTMSSCKIHLDHCEKIIEKKMLHKKKLSSKAIILHRIFSSLKLIQDSTSLENIQKSEIFLNEKNYKNFLTGSKPTFDQLEVLNNDNFKGIFRGGSRSNRNKNNRNKNISKNSKSSSVPPISNNYLQNSSNIVNNNNNNDDNSNSRANSNINEYENNNSLSPSSQFYNSRSGTNNSKRGKYNEKITDNGKVRIEFIVNNDDEDINGLKFNNGDSRKENIVNADAEIPAFVDITRTSFQPSKNKLDDKVVSSDAIYGLPNSLILMFGEIVPLTRFKKYHEDHNIELPLFFDELAEQLEFKLLTWKLEWTLIHDEDNASSINDSINDNSSQNFISPRHEGIYHHVMSFYHALIIYFYRFIEDVNPMYLLERIEKVLFHLNKIQEILENNKETSYIIPLFWQGFIAGSEAMTLYLQNGFNKWGQNIAQTGIGTYWNARQIMLEIWRRKNHNVKNNSWVDVLRDWKTNVMLT